MALFYFAAMIDAEHDGSKFDVFSHSVFGLLNQMWLGLSVGIFFVGVLDKIPREFVISALGKNGGFSGMVRATAAGVLLDLCSHGILAVGSKLYERGVSVGQVMAFLIASPWNSISLTLILWSLIGFNWMITFLLLSMLVAIITGLIFEQFEQRNVLPKNPNKTELPEDFKLWKGAKEGFKNSSFSPKFILDTAISGIKGSKIIIKWLFFGVVIAAAVRVFMNDDMFSDYFGASLLGLVLTVTAATIIEVCSEGSTPIAADILTRAGAPGNSFTFLMAGVSTDYTEIMVLKDTTKSWKIALFLPLITLPQIITLGILLNNL